MHCPVRVLLAQNKRLVRAIYLAYSKIPPWGQHKSMLVAMPPTRRRSLRRSMSILSSDEIQATFRRKLHPAIAILGKIGNIDVQVVDIHAKIHINYAIGRWA